VALLAELDRFGEGADEGETEAETGAVGVRGDPDTVVGDADHQVVVLGEGLDLDPARFAAAEGVDDRVRDRLRYGQGDVIGIGSVSAREVGYRVARLADTLGHRQEAELQGTLVKLSCHVEVVPTSVELEPQIGSAPNMPDDPIPAADPSDPGLLRPEQAALLTDQYELAMTSSYHERGMDEPAIFELFARSLPPRRDWLLCAGIGPVLRLVAELRFGEPELAYLRSLGFAEGYLERLAGLRFSGDVEAIPEGTVCFANEPIMRVTAPRIEAQLLETLLLNQVNFQTMVATKAARVVLAAGGGDPGAGDSVIDFSPRRDHGVDAAMKVARSAAVAGCGGTSNVAAAMRYGLRPAGTMAHSYVLSFGDEKAAFRAFLQDHPENTILLVDTFDTLAGVRNAIEASRATGIALRGVRLDSGDLDVLSREARRMLDEAGMTEARIVASGDLEEGRIAALVAAGAPIDVWGVGTDLGTSRDSPVVNGVYKLVADRRGEPDLPGGWRGVAKLSPHKETLPGAKQVFRRFDDGTMVEDLIAAVDEELEGTPLLAPAMRGGEIVLEETLAEIRERSSTQLRALPDVLRRASGDQRPEPYPVRYSERLKAFGGA
jgi:nicotinate phosphoribosyltransferase